MFLKQSACEKCEDIGDHHSSGCIVRKTIFNGEFKTSIAPSKPYLMERALEALKTELKGRKKMESNQNKQIQNQDNIQLATIEHVMIGGDLAKLSPEQRVMYLQKVCETLGLNPMTRPFEYIILNGKLTLYARKDATEQLRKLHRVSITKLERQVVEDIYTVTAYAALPDGRTDSALGAVPIGHLKGEAKANAMMKCETKAKRRVTLSIAGLGMLDETEIDSIPSAKIVEIHQPKPEQIAPNSAQQVQQKTASGPSDGQLRRLFAIAREKGVSNDQVKAYISDKWGKDSSKSLTLSEYEELCRTMESQGLPGPDQDSETAELPIAEESSGIEQESKSPNAIAESDLPWNKYLNK